MNLIKQLEEMKIKPGESSYIPKGTDMDFLEARMLIPTIITHLKAAQKLASEADHAIRPGIGGADTIMEVALAIASYVEVTKK